MDRLEFDLSQGWSRGLRIVFANAAESAAFNPKVSFHVDQVHGAKIVPVSAADQSRPSPLEEGDGIQVQGDWFRSCKRPLLIKTADCLPLFYIDRMNQSIAAVHAGWRGLQKGIHLRPFESGNFNPKTTWVWCGPSLNDFEVRPDMWEQFPADQRRTPIFLPTATPEVLRFSPWEFLTAEFKKTGVDLFYNTEVNTSENESFWSYRREKNRSNLDPNNRCKGSNYSWISFAD